MPYGLIYIVKNRQNYGGYRCYWLSLQRIIIEMGRKGGSRVLAMLYFWIWVLAPWVC